MAGGNKLADALREAGDTAAQASRIAVIIQNAREDDVSATRTAYRILGELGLARYTERPVHPPPNTEGDKT